MRGKILISRFKRLLLIVLGLGCLGLGIVGYVIPGLPGTIWLILAATLFLRSSDRLYNWVIHHRVFGSQVRGFLETGEIPMRAKLMSIGCIWVFSMISVFLAPYGWLFDVPILLLAVAGTLYITSRTTARSST